MPAQVVDATLPKQGIPQYFLKETDLLALLAQNLTRIACWGVDLAGALALAFSSMRVRAECCVDPLIRQSKPVNTWAYLCPANE